MRTMLFALQLFEDVLVVLGALFVLRWTVEAAIHWYRYARMSRPPRKH